MIKTYNNGEKIQLSRHLNSYDFRCKCGGDHKIKIDTKLVEWLEFLCAEAHADSIKVYSGFRCKKHDIKVGGSGKGYHTKGKAADFYLLRDKKRVPSNECCVLLENMDFYQGIGYRCGGEPNSMGDTHIATRLTQSYINEAISSKKTCCKTWYKYFDVYYRTLTKMKIRAGAGTNYKCLGYKAKDTKYQALEVKHKKDEVWLRIAKNQWICLCQGAKYYSKLEGIN